jgi:hypothetical protein
MTVWRAYRAARARANWNVHDREAFRQQRVFEARLIKVLTTYDEAREVTRFIGDPALALGARVTT